MPPRALSTVALLAAAALPLTGTAPALATPSAPTPSTASAPAPSASPGTGLVRLTGALRVTAEEPGRPAQAALSVDGRLVPVEASPVAAADPGDRVTVDVAVPQDVARSAARGETITTVDGSGDATRHPLDPADLSQARDATPADADSAIGQATVATAVAPGTARLSVDRVVTTSAAPAAPSAAARTRSVTVVRVRPRGSSGAALPSEAQITRQVAGADRFWEASSEGTVRMRLARIEPAYTSRYSCDDYFGLWQDAADRVGWSERSSTSLALVLPVSSGCDHGLGTIGEGVTSAGYLYTSGAGADVLAHEVGHNMSLQHADSLVCSATSDATHLRARLWSSGCRQLDYGDGQDIMGIDDVDTPSGPLSTPQALRLGLLPSWAVKAVGAQPTTVTVRRYADHVGQRAARVRNPATGVTYFVEYRPAAGADRYNAWGQAGGVRVLRVNPSTGETVLLDPTPTGSGGESDRDTTLRPGRTVRSYDGGLTVTTLEATSTQARVRLDASVTPPTFARTREPRVTGTPGVGRTLSVDRGAWSPSPTRYAYRWKRGGVVIRGAVGSTYRPTTADAGRYLSVEVTVSRPGYRDAVRTTARVGVPIHARTAPSVAGTPRVGARLTARVGSWTPAPDRYAYQWYRGSRAVTGATGYSYLLRSADAGQSMRLKVTARRDGHSSGQAWSAPTSRVAR